MTIECYYSECQHHSCWSDPEGGPFCYEENCVRSREEIVMFHHRRQEALKKHGLPLDPEVTHDS